MDLTNANAALCLVSLEEMRLHAHTKDWQSPAPLSCAAMARFFRTMPITVPGCEQMNDEAVLRVFCTEEAIARLLTMPNQFWFWRMLYRALQLQSQDRASRLGDEAVKQAILEEKQSVSRSYGPSKSLEELTATEACTLMAAGVILIHFRGTEPMMVHNPVFA